MLRVNPGFINCNLNDWSGEFGTRFEWDDELLSSRFERSGEFGLGSSWLGGEFDLHFLKLILTIFSQTLMCNMALPCINVYVGLYIQR